jgi:uncharacterized damage-inducible protein DinB
MTNTPISKLIDHAVKHELSEDEEDIRAFQERSNEPTISFESVLKDLKSQGKM